jgi:hypothetical protein
MFSVIGCFCDPNKNNNNADKSATQTQVQQAQLSGREKLSDINVIDSVLFHEQQKNDMIAFGTKDNIDSRLVITPRGVWTANLGGNVVFHYVAITFLPDNSFIYRDACADGCVEVDSDGGWEKIDGTTGKWYTESNKITVIFSDGYAVTVPYIVTNEELKFNFGDDYDERLGSGEGILRTYRKERYSL